MSSTQTVLELQHISKSFPGVKALDDVNFSLKEGTVHVLCGENGAGKSTLMKIIDGIYQADEGDLFLNGNKVQIKSPIQAKANGIAMIFQELSYVPDMTLEENLCLGNWPKKNGMIDWKSVRKKTKDLLAQEGLPYAPDVKLRSLSVSDIQMIEILKAVCYDAKIIIMDEPTSAITTKEVAVLFKKIAELKARGTSIIYISHKMEEIFQIADDITIIRDGKSIISGSVKDFTEDAIITHMVGRSIENIYPKEEVPIGDVVFEAKHLSSKDMFEDVSLNVRKGEIVGMAGLVGAGRSEVCRAIFGLDPLDSGEITLAGRPYKPKDVTHAIKNKILMITEDRKKEGIIGVRSCRENITLTNHHIQKGAFINLKQEVKDAKRMSDMLKVRFAGIETPIGSLSGGNQQKVLLARWLMLDSDLLILDEPTRGIDVGAKLEIYNIITDLAKKGYAILMISSEMPELLGMCDRIYVMSQGYIKGCLNRNEFEQERIMQLATGHTK